VVGVINSQYTGMEGKCSTFATASSEAKALLDQLAGGKPTASQPPAATSEPPAASGGCVDVGCKAPDFTLGTPAGTPFSLSSLKGRKVILAFMSTRCGTCLELVKCLEQVYAAWPRDQLEIVSVIPRESVSDIERWIKLYEVKNIVLVDNKANVFNVYKPEKTPGMFFLDAAGTIKAKEFPPYDDCVNKVDSLLRLY
jgi:peroxiredoxin